MLTTLWPWPFDLWWLQDRCTETRFGLNYYFIFVSLFIWYLWRYIYICTYMFGVQKLSLCLCLPAQFTSVSNQTSAAFYEVSLPANMVQSASLCAEACIVYSNSTFTCNSFDFCASDQQRTCRLSTKHTSAGSMSEPSTCDHYSSNIPVTTSHSS